jgi:hypothetical protein
LGVVVIRWYLIPVGVGRWACLGPSMITQNAKKGPSLPPRAGRQNRDG